MKSYADWKDHQARLKLEEAGEGEIMAIFDDLRETIKRVAENAGVLGTMKRGLFGAVKGLAKATFGKDSKAAAAVPDVSSNYDLNRTGALGTLGRAAWGGVKDVGTRLAQDLERKREIEKQRRERNILTRENATEIEEGLFLEWDKNALEVIMAKVDEAEGRVLHHVQQMSEPSGAGSHQAGHSWQTDSPGHGSTSTDATPTHGNIPDSELYHQMQVSLPRDSVERVERGYEKDPLMQKILQVAGRSHMKNVFPKVAEELRLDVSQVLRSVEQKYGRDVAEILMGKTLNKSSRERLDSLGGEVERRIHVPLMYTTQTGGPTVYSYGDHRRGE